MDGVEKNLNEWDIFGERSLNWCSWGVEAIESGMVRILNDDLSSSILLWGRLNERHLREDIMRKSWRWFTGDVMEEVVKLYIAGMFWWEELKLMLRLLICLLLIKNKGVCRRVPYKLSRLWLRLRQTRSLGWIEFSWWVFPKNISSELCFKHTPWFYKQKWEQRNKPFKIKLMRPDFSVSSIGICCCIYIWSQNLGP